MIIKEFSAREDDIASLERILARPDISKDVRKQVETELRKVRSGIRGEKEAAHLIDFHFGNSDQYAVIHDLRLDVGGRVAQIDHLVINRLLQIFVCETKNFSEGLACNEHGEWVGFYNNRPFGIASPIDQNLRHAEVLFDLLDKRKEHDWHPTRFGLKMGWDLMKYVLVSNTARIQRPKKAKIEGLERVIKIEQFATRVQEDYNPEAILRLLKPDKLRVFAEGLCTNHQPITFDWEARFGIDPSHDASPKNDVQKAKAQAEATQQTPGKTRHCDQCEVEIDSKVLWFCRFNKSRFEGRAYCRDCQANYPKG